MRFEAPESLSEQIAQHIGQRIVVRSLEPGERIQELKVAGELNVSRGSVREALLILERRHLVEIYPRRGAVVSEMTLASVNALYDIYIDLLCMLGRKVLERWSGHEISGLAEQVRTHASLLDGLNGARNDSEQVIDAGFELVRNACQMVENPFLQETLENFRPAISRTYYMVLENRPSEAAKTGQLFLKLADSAATKDAAELQQVIQEYGEHQRQQILTILMEENA
ncbi:MAG: GntR family transcriptional regulator [Marinobacter sp.]|uniref:GntR family transcriptional regulator n=1 Tax=unclassified Marinobacter TaxID=83889 RepID=UPI00273B6C8F|nr:MULTISPECIES: GntR family transcriptional regulator [unclassified Marinobacter]MDP4548956.1 GntR family transcriptional regulator [Marinobacter sp. MDS2]